MKDLGNKLIQNLHYLIVAYAVYTLYGLWESHSLRMEQTDAEFPSVHAEIAQNQKKVREMQDFVKKAEESKIRVEEVAKNIEAAQKQLPPEINDNEILTFFNQEINALNIKDPSLVPGREIPATFFISKEYQIKAKGTFLQILVFLERVGAADRIYNVKKLTLTNGDNSTRGRFQIVNFDGVIDAFRFNPAFKVERASDPSAPKSAP